MTREQAYTFRRAALADLPLLRHWQSARHVRAWWNDHDPFDAEKLDDPKVARWVVAHDGLPFAYMQDYAVHGWGGHHFDDLPEGSRGIDQYIGVAGMLGNGHGQAFIAQRLRALFAAGAPCVATDPHPDNARAIAAYQRVGFKRAAPQRSTPWGVILPMVARRAARWELVSSGPGGTA